MTAASAVLEPRSLFAGRYRVERCIMQGGMGAVYEVVDERTQRRRALKVMLPSIVADPDLRARFRLEATIAAGVESEHIVETFDAGVDEATSMPFLVMELLRGDDLGAVLRRAGRLTPQHVVRLLHQVALALDKTHASNIVHRDLKPENLFVTRRDDGTERVKILDFGIAKVIAQSTGAAQTRSIGSPMYMAPEQITGEGRVDGRADLYALGHITYTLLVGKAFWDLELSRAESVYPFMLKVLQGAPEAPSVRAAPHGVALPFAFDAWFRKATSLVAGLRFEQATTMLGALADALRVPRIPLAIEEGTGGGGEGNAATISSDAMAAIARSRDDEASLPQVAAGSARTTGAVSRGSSPPPVQGGRRAMTVGVVAVAALMGAAAAAWQSGAFDSDGHGAATSPATATGPAAMEDAPTSSVATTIHVAPSGAASAPAPASSASTSTASPAPSTSVAAPVPAAPPAVVPGAPRGAAGRLATSSKIAIGSTPPAPSPAAATPPPVAPPAAAPATPQQPSQPPTRHDPLDDL